MTKQDMLNLVGRVIKDGGKDTIQMDNMFELLSAQLNHVFDESAYDVPVEAEIKVCIQPSGDPIFVASVCDSVTGLEIERPEFFELSDCTDFLNERFVPIVVK